MNSNREEADCGRGLPRERFRWARALVADAQLRFVLAAWGFCTLTLGLAVHAYGVSLPHCDDFAMTPVAVGKVPLSWAWLWESEGEHRQPLLRWAVVALGRMASWDWQVLHYANLAALSAGALALLWAAREVRGHSAPSDVFLCLLVLSPWHYETVINYGYANALPGGMMCLAVGLAAARWPQRSVPRLALFLLLVLGIIGAGGPAGTLWAMGLGGVVVLGLFGATSRPWKLVAIPGAAIVAAAAGGMLMSIPHIPQHAAYRSDSAATALAIGGQVAVGWMGGSPLLVIWPWALIALVAPGLVLLGHALRDASRLWRGDGRGAAESRPWLDLTLVLLASLAVAAAIGFGRGRSGGQWSPRYAVLTQPIGILLYLLMVRLRAPLAMIPQALALGMALCVGWCWPVVLGGADARHSRLAGLEEELRRGAEPLSALTVRYAPALNLIPEIHSRMLLESLVQLRGANLSVFKDRRLLYRPRTLGRPQSWEAEAGSLGGGLRRVDDEYATEGHAVEVAPPIPPAPDGGWADVEPTAAASYRIDVPVGGYYSLCCRLLAPEEGPPLTVRIDGGPALEIAPTPGSEYRPCSVDLPEKLGRGAHTVALGVRPGVRLDLLELTPRRPPRPADRRASATGDPRPIRPSEATGP